MIEKELLFLLKQEKTVALVTIIDKSGSAPRLPGSKMIVETDGSLHGTIGGGQMEHAAHQAATRVATGESPPLLTEFDMRGTGAKDDADMVCGGIQLVLIEQITPEMIPAFEQALECFNHGARGVWTINITDPAQPIRSFTDLRTSNPPPDIDMQEIMRRRSTRLIASKEASVVIDPLPKCGTLVLIGGGHVSKEVAQLAAYVDFDVVVCDDRQNFSNPKRFPMAQATHVLHDFNDIFATIDQGEEYYLLILTRGHRYDQEALAQALKTPARYIGMIGSKRKRDICYANLRDQGFGNADFARVHCPVGLAIGSETPKEIAISIIGELIAARSGSL